MRICQPWKSYEISAKSTSWMIPDPHMLYLKIRKLIFTEKKIVRLYSYLEANVLPIYFNENINFRGYFKIKKEKIRQKDDKRYSLESSAWSNMDGKNREKE